ncbi:MAG: hypothetical protein KBD51_02805 [Candidatus Levybacteria bacterium]|nr:hypothetical protein [Candidatus Levybacteria bacterium]
MENQNNNQLNSNPKNLKKLLIPIFLIIIIAIGVLGFLIFNKNKSSDDPQFIDDKEKEQIERQSIPGASEFEKDGISFSHPADYKVNELEKNYYVVFKEGKSIPSEAGINIDVRRTGVNKSYEQALKAGRESLTEQVEKEIPGGVKMFGKIKEGLGAGIPTLYVYLKHGDGAIKVEHSGEILNEAVFDQVVNSIKIN